MSDECAPDPAAEDMSFMGTMEEARAKFFAAVDLWIKLRQPLMANAAAHKKRDMSEHEARFQLANAALLLAWHMRASPDNAAALAEARAEVERLTKYAGSAQVSASQWRKDFAEAQEQIAALTAANEAMRGALDRWQRIGCPDCGGDCYSANPPVACCIMQETRAALAQSSAEEASDE